VNGARALAIAAVLVTGGTVSVQPGVTQARQSLAPIERVEAERRVADQELARLEHDRLRLPDDDAVFADAAKTAWRYARDHVEPATGLIAPVRDYPFATIWDVGSMLAALYSAHELGLVDGRAYEARVSTILGTLARVQRYDHAVYARSYDTRNGAMAQRRPDGGAVAGWSALDIGRLLIWLRIIGTHPAFADRTAGIVNRIDLGRIVHSGYLWGSDLDATGKAVTYQEGRIGYEQYAAQGYRLWNARADKALNLMENAVPITIEGQALVADVRREDRLNSEPFLLLGLELGWDPPARRLVQRMLLAQEQRYRDTGALTITGEDAIGLAPYYFYYYCVYTNGKQFGVDVQDRRAAVDGPRWLSTKSAFALQALMPGRYSELALRQLRGTEAPDGWASGIYERTGKSTETPNINTAAVILTSALVHQTGEPVLAHAQRSARSDLAGPGTP